MPGTPRHYRRDDLVAADYRRQQGWEIAAARWLGRRRRGSLLPLLARYRRDEAIPPAWVADDEAISLSSIAQRLTERCNMNPQSTFIDDGIGPGVGDQLFLGDRFAGVLDQCDQNVERTTTKAQRLTVVEQHSLRRDQPERSEDEGFVIHGGTVLPGRGFIQRPLNFATR